MRERIYFQLVNMLKMPFTRGGVAVIEAQMRSVHQEGVLSGAFSDDVPPIISIPDPVTLDPNLRAMRKFEGVTFEFRLAGGVHFVGVRGTITV